VEVTPDGAGLHAEPLAKRLPGGRGRLPHPGRRADQRWVRPDAPRCRPAVMVRSSWSTPASR